MRPAFNVYNLLWRRTASGQFEQGQDVGKIINQGERTLGTQVHSLVVAVVDGNRGNVRSASGMNIMC